MVDPTLVPQAPPERRSRKARAYGAEIRRLQEEGYTLDAIRQALADVGVGVSKSTVQREATRKPQGPAQAVRVPIAPLVPAEKVERASGDADRSAERYAAAQRLSGRDVAAAFVSQRINNPLLRKDQR